MNDSNRIKKNNRISFRTGCLIVGSVLFLAMIISFLPGFYMRHFAEPEEYFEYVAERQAESSVDLCAKLYENMLNYLNVQDSGGAMEIGAHIDEDVLELLSFVLSSDLTWLENPNVSLTYSLYEERLGLEMGAFLGEDALMGIEAVYDISKEQAYMQLPQLSEVWVTEGLEADVAALYELQAMYERYPDAEAFEEMLLGYIMGLMECVENVEKGKSTLTVEGISQKCVTLTTQIDSDVFGGNDEVTLVLYVDGRHRVVGAEVCSKNWSLYYAVPRKGTRCGIEICFDTGDEHYYLVGSGKLTGTEMSAELELSYNQTDCFHLKVDELSWMKLLSGSLYGRFEIMPLEGADAMLEAVFGRRILPVDVSGYGIQLFVEKEQNRTKVEASLLGDEEQLLQVYVLYLTGEGTPVELPAMENCISLQEEQALERWKDTVNWDSYFAQLRNTKIPEWVVEYLENSIISG